MCCFSLTSSKFYNLPIQKKKKKLRHNESKKEVKISFTLSTIQIETMGRNRSQHREVKPSKFKTTLCQFHIKGEECPFGEKCAFAHGDHELRNEQDNAFRMLLPDLPLASSSTSSNDMSTNSSHSDSSSSHSHTNSLSRSPLLQGYRNNPYSVATCRMAIVPSSALHDEGE